MKKVLKKLLVPAIIVLIAILAFLLWPQGDKTTMALTTSQVKKTDLTTTVTATGTVEPITLVEVGTQVSGVISKIFVDFNSVVKAGQVLAELDKQLLQSEVETAQANLQSKKVDFNQQQLNYNRYKDLYAKQAVSKADWEDAEASYQTAKLAVTSSQAAVLKARTNLGYATISATIDGVVISRAVEQGQTVAASFSTPTLFTIANDLTKMRVIANVDEADIGQVQNGQRVQFTVDAYPNDKFEGEVIQVRLEATTTSNVVTYEVVINAPNPDMKLKPGLTANVSIYTLEEKGVLTIPSKSLRFTPDETILKQVEDIQITGEGETTAKDKNTIWVKSGNIISPRSIKTGAADAINIQVTEGLKEGEEVVTGIAQKTEVAASQGSSETSPFMPQRPGGNKKK